MVEKLIEDRYLNMLAAEHIMGEKWYAFGHRRKEGPWRRLGSWNPVDERLADGTEALASYPDLDVPHFAESMDAAWKLVEALSFRKPLMEPKWLSLWHSSGSTTAMFSSPSDSYRHTSFIASRAITVAALLAVGVSPYQEA